MFDLIGVYGAAGYGREIMPLVRSQVLSQLKIQKLRLLFIDDGASRQSFNGHEVVSWEEFLAIPATRRAVALAIASAVVREKLATKCDAAFVPLLEVRAANVVQMDNVELGDGACLSPFVTLTSNIRIGRAFHANLYAYIGHDCIIGDFVTFAPGVKCNGNVIIEDHAYIGSGAILRQGSPGKPLTIGRGAVVGMGAVVTKNVPAGATVVGNPARLLMKD